MFRAVVVPFLAILSTACLGQSQAPTGPTSMVIPPPPPPPAVVPQGQTIQHSIAIGEKVTGTFASRDTWVIDLTAGTSGIAVIRVTWNAGLTSVDLTWDEEYLKGPPGPGPAELIVRRPVEAGRTYRVTILDAYPWENYGSPFLLETSLE